MPVKLIKYKSNGRTWVMRQGVNRKVFIKGKFYFKDDFHNFQYKHGMNMVKMAKILGVSKQAVWERWTTKRKLPKGKGG